jgi:hypothetical protein
VTSVAVDDERIDVTQLPDLLRIAHPHAIWADYDPKKVKAGLQRSAGALAGIDREALLADISASREQDSPGRPG